MLERAFPFGDGWVANQVVAEQVVGRKLPAELFQFLPWGRRVLLVREPPARTYGSIIIPDSVLSSSARSVGWVLSVGPLVGTPDLTKGIGPAPMRGYDMILLRVAIGRYAGVPYLVSDDPGVGNEYKIEDADTGKTKALNPYMLVTDLDILGEITEKPYRAGAE